MNLEKVKTQKISWIWIASVFLLQYGIKSISGWLTISTVKVLKVSNVQHQTCYILPIKVMRCWM